MEISLTVAIDDPDELKRRIADLLGAHSAGPWSVWLTPHDSDPTHWRLRVSCPGYVTTVSLPPGQQTYNDVLEGVARILESPVSCLDQSA